MLQKKFKSGIQIFIFFYFIFSARIMGSNYEQFVVEINEKQTGLVFYDASVTIINKSYKTANEICKDLFKTSMQRTNKEEYLVRYCVSKSSYFSILYLGDNRSIEIGRYYSNELTVRSNSTIIVKQTGEYSIQELAIYKFSGKQFSLVDYPYSYLNYSTKTRERVDIYSDLDLQTIVDTIEADKSVLIVLRKGDKFFIQEPGMPGGWISFNAKKGNSILKDINKVEK